MSPSSKHIVVSEENYAKLTNLKRGNDDYDIVITKLLESYEEANK